MCPTAATVCAQAQQTPAPARPPGVAPEAPGESRSANGLRVSEETYWKDYYLEPVYADFVLPEWRETELRAAAQTQARRDAEQRAEEQAQAMCDAEARVEAEALHRRDAERGAEAEG